MAAPAEERMFFLVGRGRSGTTLLKSILDAHPSLSVAPEGLFVMSLYGSYRRGRWTAERVRRFCRHVFLERRLRRWSVDPEGLGQRLLAIGEPGFARLCAEVYELHADRTGKEPGRLLGDKNPPYALFVPELRAVFPRARFVHVVRDYRDNVASYLHVPFDVKSPAALAHRWVHYNAALLDAAARAPEAFHRVRFEDLVTAPAATLDALCRFLGVDAPPEMLRGYEAGGAHGAAWHRNIGRPVDAALAGQWRTKLTPAQVATLDRICQPFAAAFGYEPAEGGAGQGSRAPGAAALGWAVTTLERQVFRLPVTVQALLINGYRRLTGTLPK